MVAYFSLYSSTRGLELDAVTITAIETALVGLATAVYYLIVRTLAKKWPFLEILLGSRKTPEYKQTSL